MLNFLHNFLNYVHVKIYKIEKKIYSFFYYLNFI